MPMVSILMRGEPCFGFGTRTGNEQLCVYLPTFLGRKAGTVRFINKLEK